VRPATSLLRGVVRRRGFRAAGSMILLSQGIAPDRNDLSGRNVGARGRRLTAGGPSCFSAGPAEDSDAIHTWGGAL
jgi:hypothetical protein